MGIIFGSIVGWIFVFAGLAKIANPIAMAQTIYDIFDVKPTTSKSLATFLILVETVCGFGLVLGYKFAYFLALGLCLAFILTTLLVMIRGQKVACNCFGSQSQDEILSFKTIIRNSVFILMLFSGILLSEEAHSIQNKVISIFSALAIVVTMFSIQTLKNNPKIVVN